MFLTEEQQLAGVYFLMRMTFLLLLSGLLSGFKILPDSDKNERMCRCNHENHRSALGCTGDRVW